VIIVDGSYSFILAEEEFEETATLLISNEGVDLLQQP
jgi:hypothetical protein